jgi:hypothetical protein
MKKKLLQLPAATLWLIAKDYSVDCTNREETASKITTILKGYGYRWSDFASRYGLPE